MLPNLAKFAVLAAGVVCASCAATTTGSGSRAQIRAAIRNEQGLDPAKFPPKTVAVLPVAADPNDSNAVALSWALTEMLSQDLAQTKRVSVVERRRIGALISELALAASGRVDTVSAPRAGKLLGARRVASGSLARAGGSSVHYRVQFQLIDVANGTTSTPFSATVGLDDVETGEAELLRQLIASLGLSPADFARVAKADGVAVPMPALLHFGRGVQLISAGNVAAGEKSLSAASQLAPGFTAATNTLAASSAVNLNGEQGRRSRLRGVTREVSPLASVRTAEAVDATSSSLMRTVSLSVVVILP